MKYDKINVYNTRYNEDKLIMLVKEASHDYGESAGVVDRPERAAALVVKIFDAGRLPEERLWMLALNGGRRVVGVFEVSHGTLMSSLVHPREVFTRAVLCGAASIILAHNHPSGLLDISEQDREVTRRIRLAGELMGIPLDDHIIVADGGEFVSL